MLGGNARDAPLLVLDLNAARFMDRSELGLLLRCLRLVGAPGPVRSRDAPPLRSVLIVLRLTKLERLFSHT